MNEPLIKLNLAPLQHASEELYTGTMTVAGVEYSGVFSYEKERQDDGAMTHRFVHLQSQYTLSMTTVPA